MTGRRLRAVETSTAMVMSGGTVDAFGVDIDAVRQYELMLATAQWSVETISDRIYGLARLARWLLPTALLLATPEQLQAWQASIRHLTPNTVRVYSMHVRQFYAWATDAGLIADDPARRLAKPRVARGKPRPMAHTDVETLFAICTGPLRLVFTFAAFAGLRCGEIARLMRNDIDLYGTPPMVYVRGKGRRERSVPLIGPLIEELHAAGHGARRPGPLLLNSEGRPWRPDSLSASTNRWLHDVLGTESTLHSLRHWYGTHLARITKDPLFVRDMLGHSSVSTTEIYMDPGSMQPEQMDGFTRYVERVTGRRRLQLVPDQDGAR